MWRWKSIVVFFFSPHNATAPQHTTQWHFFPVCSMNRWPLKVRPETTDSGEKTRLAIVTSHTAKCECHGAIVCIVRALSNFHVFALLLTSNESKKKTCSRLMCDGEQKRIFFEEIVGRVKRNQRENLFFSLYCFGWYMLELIRWRWFDNKCGYTSWERLWFPDEWSEREKNAENNAENMGQRLRGIPIKMLFTREVRPWRNSREFQLVSNDWWRENGIQKEVAARSNICPKRIGRLFSLHDVRTF